MQQEPDFKGRIGESDLITLLDCRLLCLGKHSVRVVIPVKDAPNDITFIRVIWAVPDGCLCLLYQLIRRFILRRNWNNINITLSATELFEIPDFRF